MLNITEYYKAFFDPHRPLSVLFFLKESIGAKFTYRSLAHCGT